MEARGNKRPQVEAKRCSSAAVDARIQQLAANQHGRVSVGQLHELGVSSSSIAVRVRRGWLTPVARGVYAVGIPQLTPQAAWQTALLRAGPESALSDAAAGAHWRIRSSQAALIDVTTPRRKRPIDGLRLHHRSLPADELTAHQGLRITTVSRTVFDLAQRLSDARLESAIGEADKLALDFTPSLQTLLGRYPRARGTVRLRRVLDRIGIAGAHLLRSELEVEFLELVYECDWPRVETNYWVELADRRYELDVAWPALRLAVELDSREHHSDWAAQQRDRDRDRALAVAGWTVIRVTARMLRFERAALRADLDALIYTARPRRRSSVGRALHS